jgi:hypothetical protein
VDESAEAKLQGFITRQTLSGEFVINNHPIKVSSATKLEGGTEKELVVGKHVSSMERYCRECWRLMKSSSNEISRGAEIATGQETMRRRTYAGKAPGCKPGRGFAQVSSLCLGISIGDY